MNQSTLIYSSKYKKLWFNLSQQELLYTMLSTTESLQDATHRREIMRATLAMKKHQIKFIISDFREFKFINTPDTQDWIVENIVPIWKEIGIKKIGIILPEEFFASLGIQQISRDAQNKTLPYRQTFFKTLEDARMWFLEEEITE
jgi:hypothetical protein